MININPMIEINGSNLECDEIINEKDIIITIRPEDIKVNPDKNEIILKGQGALILK